jgi:hypothetical protein
VLDEALPVFAGRRGGEVGDAELDVGGGREQRRLGAEVADHQRRVDPDVPGDGADGRRAVALGGEAPATPTVMSTGADLGMP